MKQFMTFVTTLTFLFLTTAVQASILTTVNNGNYGDPNHWDLGFAPGPSDTAIINHETYNVGIASIKRIEINNLFGGASNSMLTITRAGFWNSGHSCSVNITSEGEFIVQNSWGRQMQANFINNGTLYWIGGSVGFVQRTFTNNGIFYASSLGGTFGEVLGCTFVNNGLISVGSSGVVALAPSTFTNNANIAVNNGTLSVSGTLTNTDTIIISTGATMVVNTFNTLVLNPGSGLLGGGTLQIKGNIVPNIAQDVYPQFFLDFGAVYHTGTGSLNLLNDATWANGFIQRPVTLAANKTMTVSQNGSMGMNSTLTNFGTIDWISGGAQWNAGYLVNNGIVNVNGNINFSAVGPALFTNNGTMNFNQSGTAIMSLHFDNSGTVNLNNGISLFAANTTNTGSINIAAGKRMDNQGTLFLNTGTLLQGAGTLRSYGNIQPNMNVVFNCNFHLDGGSILATGSGSITVNNSMLWNSGFVDRPLTINPSKTLTININSSAGLGNLLNNKGLGTWSAGSIQFSNGTLDNDGIFDFTGVVNPGGGGSLLRNDGTMNFNQTGTNFVGITAINNGIININTGDVVFGTTFTNSGIFNIPSTRVLQINGNSTFEVGTQLNGSGTLRNFGNVTMNAPVLFNPAWEFKGGSGSGTGLATIDNSMIWEGGDISFPITINPGKTMTVTTGNGKTYINATLNNLGTFVYNGTGWGLQGTAILDNDGVMNLHGTNLDLGGSTTTLLRNDGILNFDQTGTSNINSAMTNNGTINVNGGTSNAAQNFTNNGTIDIDAGKLFQLNATCTFAGSSVLIGAGTLRNNNNLNLNGVVTTSCPFEMQGFNINGPGSLIAEGPFFFVSSSINANLTVNPGRTMTVTTGNGKTLNNATLNNLGTIVYNGTGWGLQGSAIIDNDGTLNFVGTNLDLGGNGSTLLRNDGTLNFDQTGTSNINSAMVNNGIINVNGGTSNAAQNFTNNGTIDIDAAKLFQFNASATLNASSVLTGLGTLRNNNNLGLNGVVTTNCPFEMQGFNINGPGSLVADNSFLFVFGTINANVTINPGRTMTSTTGNGKTINSATLNNLGTIVYNGTGFGLQGTAIIDNDGVMNMQGTNLDLGGNGNTLLRNDGILNFDQTGTSNINSAMVNNGTINVNGGTSNAAQNFTNNGIIDIDAGRLFQLNATCTFAGTSILTGAGTLRNNNNLNLNGVVTTNCPFEMQGFNINGPGSLVADNSFLFVFGTINANVTINPGRTMTATTGNGKTLNSATLNNLGTIVYNGTGFGLQGTAIIDNDGVMNMQGTNLDLGGNGSTLLRNDGTLNFDQTGSSNINSAMTNNGTINVNGGTSNAAQNFINNGTIDIDAGKLFQFNAGATLNASSVLTGAGTLRNNNNMNLNGVVTTNCPFEMQGFNINGPGSLVADNSFLFVFGTINANLTINAGKTMTATTGNGKTLNNATLNNLGTIVYNGTGWGLQGTAIIDNDGVMSFTIPTSLGGNGTTLLNNDGIFINDNTGTGSFNTAFTNTTNGTIKGRGTLSFNNTFTNSGTVAPGLSPGILTLNKLTNSSLEIEIAGTSGGGNPVGHDSLRVNTSTALAGTLAIQFINGYQPTPGDHFTFLTSPETISSVFSTVTFNPALPNNLTGDLTYNNNFVTLTINGDCPTYYADLDGDGYGDPNSSLESCVPVNGYVENDDDCNDSNASINPNATEVCNGLDDDCDGQIDEGVQSTFYADTDADGFGDANSTTMACNAPIGFVSNDDDCDDTNVEVNPNAVETCNGVDDDCDWQVDEGVQSTFYADMDADGFGDANSTTMACTAPSGYVSNDDDCDDSNANVNPNATEVCNGMDEDCDGQIDEDVQSTFYADADSDEFGDANSTTMACTAPTGFVANDDDCADTNFDINPSAVEVCNGIDDNCNGQIDEGVQSTFYADTDADGFGNASSTTVACTAPNGYVSNDDDCDDTNFEVNPSAIETCNGMDDDCDGLIDEGVQSTFYADADGDGFGDANATTMACTQPNGYVANANDCNDANANVHPGATEICNSMDDDCDGLIDETNLSISLAAGTIACGGGTTTLTANGTAGYTPYQYSLDGGPFTIQNSFTVSAGTHTVTVKDAHNCMVSGSVTVNQPQPLAVSNVDITHVACSGGNTGAVNITVSGGTTPYSFNWSNGKHTEDIQFLVANTYSVSLTDSHGCTTSAQAVVNPKLKLVTSKTNVICNGGNDGTATATVTGGTLPYSILWSNGETTATISNLAVGSYSVTVMDALNCTRIATVSISQPAKISIAGQRINASCNGGNDGEIDLSVSNGVPPLSFNWNDGPTTEDRSELYAGTYAVTVTDAQGCTNTKSFTITEPTALTLTFTVVNVGCHGSATGKITATIAGGTKYPTSSPCNNERYCINWSNGATSRINDNLIAGTYEVTVTDLNGCVIFGSVTVTEPQILDILNVQQELLSNGKYKLTVFATGGTVPYKYMRIPGSTNYQSSNIFNNVPIGNYQIVVRDNKLCTDTVEISVPGGGGNNLLAPNDPNNWEENVAKLELESTEGVGNEAGNIFSPTGSHEIKVYPNPADNEVNLLVNKDFNQGEVTVFDLQGRTLVHQKLEGGSTVLSDLSLLENGLYMIKVQLDDELMTKRLVIQH